MADLYAVLSSILIGTADFAGGFFSRRLSVYAVIGVSTTVAAIVFFAMGVKAGGATFTTADIEAGLVTGVTVLLGTILYFKALTKGRMGVIGGIVTMLVLVPIFFSVLHGESLSTKTIIGIVLTLGGAILLGYPEMRGGTAVSAIAMAVGAAFMFGLSQVALDLGAKNDTYSVLFISEVFQAVVIGCLALATRSTGGVTRKDLFPLACIGLADAVAVSLFAAATKTGDLAVVSVLASLDPIVIALLAMVILKERLLLIQQLAFVTVIIGSIMVGRNGGG